MNNNLKTLMVIDTKNDILKLQEQATHWVDTFWSKATKPIGTKVIDYGFSQEEFDACRDDVGIPIILKSWVIEYMLFSRFQLFGLKITPKVLVFLTAFIRRPGDLSMYTAAIAHSYYPIAGLGLPGTEVEGLVTYRWLASVFVDKYLPEDALSEMWQANKLPHPYTHNLVDIVGAFQMLIPEETL